MHPVLLKIGPITLHTYGFMIAVGFLMGMFVAGREAGRQGEDPDRILDLCLTMVIVGAIASRIPYVLFNWQEFSGNWIEIFMLWRGGLVFYGGLLGGLGVFVWHVRRYKLTAWKIADILAPSVALGHAFGRIGCFSAGCCYGKECSAPWAVTFTNPLSLAPTHVPLHPTQLYSSAGLFIIFAVLHFAVRPRKSFHGQVFWTYILMYSAFRFCVEFFRGDDRGSYFLGLLSPSQSVGVILAALAVFFLLRLRKRKLS